MALSTLKFEFALAIALAVASASAFAGEKQQASSVTIRAGDVQETTVGRSYIDIEELKVARTVSYANLDLTTASGATELRKRVMEAAKDTCEQIAAADPASTSDYSCIRRVTERGLERANVAIAAAEYGSAMRATEVTRE